MGERKLIALSLLLTGISLAPIPFIHGSGKLSWSILFSNAGGQWWQLARRARAVVDWFRTDATTSVWIALDPHASARARARPSASRKAPAASRGLSGRCLPALFFKRTLRCHILSARGLRSSPGWSRGSFSVAEQRIQPSPTKPRGLN
jgi:hypothetical protein